MPAVPRPAPTTFPNTLSAAEWSELLRQNPIATSLGRGVSSGILFRRLARDPGSTPEGLASLRAGSAFLWDKPTPPSSAALAAFVHPAATAAVVTRLLQHPETEAVGWARWEVLVPFLKNTFARKFCHRFLGPLFDGVIHHDRPDQVLRLLGDVGDRVDRGVVLRSAIVANAPRVVTALAPLAGGYKHIQPLTVAMGMNRLELMKILAPHARATARENHSRLLVDLARRAANSKPDEQEKYTTALAMLDLVWPLADPVQALQAFVVRPLVERRSMSAAPSTLWWMNTDLESSVPGRPSASTVLLGRLSPSQWARLARDPQARDVLKEVAAFASARDLRHQLHQARNDTPATEPDGPSPAARRM